MTRRQISALALTTALLPVSFVGLLLANSLHPGDVALNLDPFEIDLQLRERNDDL